MKRVRHFDEESGNLDDDLFNDRDRIVEILNKHYHLDPGEADVIFEQGQTKPTVNVSFWRKVLHSK
jgi:hypothetical protein